MELGAEPGAEHAGDEVKKERVVTAQPQHLVKHYGREFRAPTSADMREFWKDSGVQRMPMRKLQENFRVWAAPRGICPLTTTGLRYMCYSIGMKKEVKSDGCTYMYKEGA